MRRAGGLLGWMLGSVVLCCGEAPPPVPQPPSERVAEGAQHAAGPAADTQQAAPPSDARAQTVLAARLADLDADLARLEQRGKPRPYDTVRFRYRAPDEASARALETELEREANYPAEVRAPAGSAADWLVEGTTTLLPNERAFHADLLPVMVEMGLTHGCELQAWSIAAVGSTAAR